MRFRHPIPVTVERGGTDPRTGDPLPNPVTHVIEQCAVYPRTSGETSSLGTEVVVGLVLLMPYGADIESGDVVRLPDDDAPWQVEGEPGHWRSPFSDWQPGSQVALIRQRGA